MTNPTGYERRKEPTSVQDIKAERWIKGSNIITGLILLVVSTGIGGGAWIGDHFISELSEFKADVNEGLKRLSDSVDGVSDKITLLNVSTAVLAVKVDNVENRVTVIEQELRN